MNNWTKVTGLEANRLAEGAGIARPGTFNGTVLQWTGSSPPPDIVETKGTLQCVSCNRLTPFALASMSEDVACSGCRTTYSLFKDDLRVGDAPGVVVVAAVLSRPATGSAYPPAIDVCEVLPC